VTPPAPRRARPVEIWDGLWYGPVAAIRPFLFARLFLALLALDCWLTFARGGSYGLAGFNVAHFRWLEALLPLPTPGLYVGSLLLCGFLALFSALSGPSRPILAAIFALYSLAWSMSQLDLYQHHYLLSLVLFCLIFLPPLRREDLYPGDAARGAPARGRRAPGPLTCAWAWRLLGALFALVYAFTALAKLEPLWLSGATPALVAQTKALPQAAADLAVALGGSRRAFFAGVAGATVALEVALSAAYALAPRQDERASARRRRACLAAWLLAAALHLGFEAMGLLIGLFSFYMLLAAGAFFLPAGWLFAAGALASAPARHLAQALAGPAAGRGWLWAALAVALGLSGIGRWLDLPGAAVALLLAAAALLGSASAAALRGAPARTRARVLAAAAAGLALATLVSLRPERHEFHWSHATSLRQLGDFPGALAALGRAERHAPAARRGRIRSDRATVLLKQGRLEEAIADLREALRLLPRQPVAHNNLGLALLRRGELDPAIAHFREALRLRPRYPTAQHNLALAEAAASGGEPAAR